MKTLYISLILAALLSSAINGYADEQTPKKSIVIKRLELQLQNERKQRDAQCLIIGQHDPMHFPDASDEMKKCLAASHQEEMLRLNKIHYLEAQGKEK